ncbi:calcium-binding protein [Sulfitobacter sp. HNIBRBA2951]|uniref:calcium-binding protein n=1 Tax=Sulfitobacter aquimarinus TaxID=3158557 RepID=UPI0032DFA996
MANIGTQAANSETIALDMSNADLFTFATLSESSSTWFSFSSDNGESNIYAGSGITTSGGMITGGTIDTLLYDVTGQSYEYFVNSFSAPAVDLVNADGPGLMSLIMGGNDTIDSGAFSDTLKGGAGNDVIYAGGGNDLVEGGTGDDTLIGEAGDDTILGQDGDDVIFAGAGADSILAGDDFDIVHVYNQDLDGSNSTIDGGNGIDELVVRQGGTFDLTGWSFNDMEIINFHDDASASSATLRMTNDQLGFGFGTVVEIEGNAAAGTSESLIIDISSSSGNFSMLNWTFADFNNSASGDDGAITVNGNTGGNFITGSIMTDNLIGNGGNDDFDLFRVNAHLGDDTLNGGDGMDELYLLDAGTYLLNEGLQLVSIEQIRFSDSGGTTFNLTAGEIDELDELAANATILGSAGTDRLILDMEASETFDVSGWNVSSFVEGTDTIAFVNGDGSASNLTTTDFGELIETGTGHATVNSGGGDDTINTGGGADSISAGTGDDLVHAENNADTIDGGAGRDTLQGGLGADSILGGDDDDVLYDYLMGGGADNFADTLDGGAGDDMMVSTGGDDSIVASDGGADLVILGDNSALRTVTMTGISADDQVRIETVNDVTVLSDGSLATANLNTSIGYAGTLTTGSGNDTVSEGTGISSNLNFVDLGAGDDRMEGTASAGVDVFDGGVGNDTFQNTSTGGYTINLQTGFVDGVAGALVNFENFIGNGIGGDETVTAVDAGSMLNGAGGDDSLIGSMGDDTLLGGTGTDDLAGGDGTDSMSGGTGNDTMRGNLGDDTMSGQANADQMFGGQGVDVVMGGAGFDLVDGGDGNDTVDGGSGNDTVRGGNGHDEVRGVAGSDTIEGGGGNDSILGGNGFDTIDGGTGLDTIDAGLGNDVAMGGGGNDSIAGNAGSDTLNGDGGNDTIEGQGGNDVIDGGDGSDVLNGGVNNDTITGGNNNDTMTGGIGADDFVFADGQGADVITDFLVNVDDLDFDALSTINNFAQFQTAATNVGADLVVDLGGGNQLTLLGVQEAQMDVNDMIF